LLTDRPQRPACLVLAAALLLSCVAQPAPHRDSPRSKVPPCPREDPNQPRVFRLTPWQACISRWAQSLVQARHGNDVLRQNTRSLDALYEQAAPANLELVRITWSVAAATGGRPVFPPGGGLKDRRRAEEKIEVEFAGDASRLGGIARSSIEYSTVDDVYGALEFTMQEPFDVVRIKDRSLEPLPTGFWNIHLNLRMSNAHVVELQLHLEEIWRFGRSEGHRLYERQRQIRAEAARAGRALTSREKELIDQLDREQKEFYEAAFCRGQSSHRVSGC
jgi:hypothetical protein